MKQNNIETLAHNDIDCWTA